MLCSFSPPGRASPGEVSFPTRDAREATRRASRENGASTWSTCARVGGARLLIAALEPDAVATNASAHAAAIRRIGRCRRATMACRRMTSR